MTFDDEKDCFVLATGRTFYAFGGILGLAGCGEDDKSLYYGFDGEVYLEGGGDFTASEREEVAAEMIARWKRWAAGR